ncbi:MAG: LysM peptidoglycan-binding domain-containing protein [Prevotellaceae bacterium]|jgi:LysM repeat protein|nr:LysM peptidoglycan-binding domain-containing protein [Prevotellaceae bacterium]
MRFIRLISIITLLITFTTASSGQDVQVQKSTEKIRIDGNVFYVHNVKKGETIYSLTKVYNISEDELKRTNPQLVDGLKDGQVLRIPEKPLQAAVAQTTPSKPDGAVEHEVQRKETLYSISRQYNVSIDAIKRANPTIDDNIKKGQILYIPTQAAINGQANAIQPEVQQPVASIRHEKEGDNMAGEHIYHSVQKGETLYSIAKQYSANENTIKQLNSDAFKDNALLEGAVLRIPKYEPENLSSGTKILFPGYTYQPNETLTPVNSYRYTRTDIFNVAFLIPFNAKQSESATAAGDRKQNQYLEFYEGALLAIDTLKKDGLSLNVSTFDVSDARSLESALRSSDVQASQLVIAPVSAEFTEPLTAFAQRRQIPVVLARESVTDSIVAYNPYLIKLRPSPQAENHKLLKDICLPNRNIVLVAHHGGDTILLHSYSQILKEKGCTYSTLSYSIAQSRNELESKLNSTQENHIIVASANSQPFVMNILETLNVLSIKGKLKTFIYGSPEWRKMSMNSMQLAYLYSLNLRTAQVFYVDYNNLDTKKFIAKYRRHYKGEPGNYSFYGHDVSLYFLSCLKEYGANFMPFLPSHEESLLQSRFLFKQIGYGGMKNEGVFLLEYQPDLNIIRK